MFKKGLFLATVMLFIFSTIGSALALEMGNKRKGKYTYRKVYKACMQRGEVDSPKPPISPDAKTQAQWTRTFEKMILKTLAAKRNGMPCLKRTFPIYTPICMSMRQIPRPRPSVNKTKWRYQ